MIQRCPNLTTLEIITQTWIALGLVMWATVRPSFDGEGALVTGKHRLSDRC